MHLRAVTAEVFFTPTDVAKEHQIIEIIIEQQFILDFHEFLVVIFVFFENLQEFTALDFDHGRVLVALHVHMSLSPCEESHETETLAFS